MEGDIRDTQSQRGTKDTKHLRIVDAVIGEDVQDHMDGIAKSVWEKGTNGPIDHAGGQSGAGGGFCFTLEESAGNFARGIHFFNVIDGEGKEVLIFCGFLTHSGCYQNGAVAVFDENAAVGLFGHPARLHIEFAAAEIDLAADDVEVMHCYSILVPREKKQ